MDWRGPTASPIFRISGPEGVQFGNSCRILAYVLDVGADPDDIGLFNGRISVRPVNRFVLAEIKFPAPAS